MSGGVKVAVRVRPFNAREKENNSVLCIEMEGNKTIIKDENNKEKDFAFDYSFWSHDGFKISEDGYSEPIDDRYADQQKVYEAVGKEILDNAWLGYNCCLFAYGQTGSGKSYSMVGYKNNKGIVPISCEEIFKRVMDTTKEDKMYEVCVSMLEIYNEKVHDLLVPVSKRPQSGLKVRESKTIGVFVEHLTKYPVVSYEEIAKKMDEGYENRTIGSTLMNATSSRAHTIVTIEFRQITIINNKQSIKSSNINLVDLAGSERSSSTGATGDRLKEGCNINKSLLVLGNVINTLADKALGKKKDILPPYRDSSLTRILQSALGGNAKTVMICALSPASINYEETLSTLRYADRAKKIQNKAVINESEQDKIIRQLKEENIDLKKLIEDLNKRIMGEGGVIRDEDKLQFLEMKEQYEANSRAMEDLEKPFQDKILEAHNKDQEIIGEKVDVNHPHLINLNEDPQLSHKLRYSLQTLPFYVGRKHGNPPPQITLSGIGIKNNHALFQLNNKNEIYVMPNEPQAKDYIFINGKKLTSNNGQVLKQKDRITFGTNTIFLFMLKSDNKEIFEIDWESAQLELQKEIELNNKIQEDENEKRKKAELEIMKRDLEEKYNKEKFDVEEKLRLQQVDYEQKMKDLEQTVERSKIESERKHMETLLQEKLKLLESEKARKQREYENREKNEIAKKELMKKENDRLHKSEKLEQTLNNLKKKLNKMKIIVSELRRNFNLSIHLTKNIVDYFKDSKMYGTNVQIRVENYEEGTVYYWNTETFNNRYDMLNDLLDRYQDEDFDITNLKKEEDPLWDEPRANFLGVGFYKLEPLVYLMNNSITTSVISSDGEQVGNITVDVIPFNEDESEFEEVPDNPEELIGQPINYKVYIKSCTNLPDNFCTNSYVEYTCFHDNTTNTTQPKDGKDRNPVFEEFFVHHIDYITKDDIDYFMKEKLCFKVFAFEEVEIKGKIPRDSVINPNMNPSSGLNQSGNPFEQFPGDKPQVTQQPKRIDNIIQSVPIVNSTSQKQKIDISKQDEILKKKKKIEKEKDNCILF